MDGQSLCKIYRLEDEAKNIFLMNENMIQCCRHTDSQNEGQAIKQREDQCTLINGLLGKKMCRRKMHQSLILHYYQGSYILK